MRTNSTSLTEMEIQAFTRFALEYDIITDGEIGVRNADTLCRPIIDADSDLTGQTLSESFARVRTQLQIKSSTYKKADELASKLSPEEQATYRVWANGQKLLIGLDGSEEGYQNVASLLGWMRGNPVTNHNLDLALSNVINSPQVGQRIHFKPQPRQQDRSVVQGRPNHAFNYTEEPKVKVTSVQQMEFVNGRRNHSYVPPEDAQKKGAVQGPPDAWHEIIQIQLRDWVTPNQEARLQNEYKAGVAAGRTNREISESLAVMVKDQHRGR